MTTILTKNRQNERGWRGSSHVRRAEFLGHRVLGGQLSVPSSKQSDRSKKMEQVSGDSDSD